tara:strand:- start:547 stop:744 length:198 start_codon:yes stop_codon:yes gene_type:complete
MIVQTSHSLILMVTLDFATLNECKTLSVKFYEENRCFENYEYYLKEPLKKPKNFFKLIYGSKTIE